jgi:uncharacterized protein with beta-barrel porin domain
MTRHGWGGALLATSSLLALVIGMQGSAEAAACHYDNVAGGVDNTTAQDCIVYHGGGAFTGNVTNEATGSLTTTAAEGGPLPGTSSGISVLTPGTHLTGNIVNKGTITTNFSDINIGNGNFGTPPTSPGAGATLTGSITNSGSLLSNGHASGISLVGPGSVVTGSITNDVNGIITSDDVGIQVTNGAHLGGSLINDGKINATLSHGFEINTGATIAGNVTNSATGTITTTGSAGMSIAGSSTIGGTVTNAGTITSTRYGILLAPTSVGGSVINSGTMNSGGYGIVLFGSSNVLTSSVTGNVSNTGTINANGRDGMAVFAFSNVGGAVLNSKQITAARNGILVVNTSSTAGVAHVAGGISNSGTLTSNGTGFAGIALVGGTVSNGIANTSTGVINSANGVGILVSNQTPIRLSGFASTLTGGITNQGSITAKTGIVIGGASTVSGGITNSGNITGTGGTAIDLVAVNGGEGAATTINQQAGTITGRIQLSGLADTVNITGGAISGNIVGQGSSNTVNFALGAGTFTYSNTISGVHAVNVNSGTVSLTGTNTYTGVTNVNGGILDVEGSIAQSGMTTVNANAALTGIGTVGNTTITSGGIFAPGSGTPGSSMTVAGGLLLQSGAIYQVMLNPTTASFANVMATATLGGASVNAIYANGSYISKQYTILTAGGVSGTFGSLVNTNLPTNFSASLSYDAHDAFLNLTLGFAPPPNGGLNQNQQNVANAIVGFFNSNGSIPLVFGGLTPAGLSQISGETATGSQQTTFNAMDQFMGVMTDPFITGRNGGTGGTGTNSFAEEDNASAYAADGKPRSKSERDAYAAIYRKAPLAAPFVPSWSLWAAGYGGSQTTDGNAALGSNTATSNIFGTAVGADYRFSPFTIAGFALAGGGTNFSVANAGTGRSDLFQAGAFVRHDVGPAYITAAAAYGWQNITTDRFVTIAGVDHLRAQFNANAFSGRVEGGYRFATPWMGITPYAAAQSTTFDLPAYAEQAVSGANTFALAYGARDVTDTRSELGIRTDKSFAMQNGILTLRGRFAWAHDFNPDRNIGATFQALPGASFVVNGAMQARDATLTTASAEVKWMNGWSAAATFEGEFSEVTRSYAGKGVIRYTW